MIANSTAEEGVYRSDGVRLYGLDAELELKMQSKRDKNYEQELANWIEQVSGEKLQFEDIADSLKSGIVLCKLLNVIQPGTVKHINTKPIALMEVENIQLYLKGCWNLGVPTSDLFVTSDLYQKKGIPQVLQNIVSLARVAQTLPDYTGPKFGAKLSTPAPSKKWETVEANQVVYAAEMQARQTGAQAALLNICYECGTPKKHLAKMCDKCGSEYAKQDLTQLIASVKSAKLELLQLQEKCKRAEEENKKLLDQLKNFHSAEFPRDAPQRESSYTQADEKSVNGDKVSDTKNTAPSTRKAPALNQMKPLATTSLKEGKELEFVSMRDQLRPTNLAPPTGKGNLAAAASGAGSKSENDLSDIRGSRSPRASMAVGGSSVELSRVEQEKRKLEQDRSKLLGENERLAKDNAKLTIDYQAVDRKYRDEASRVKDMEDKYKLLERKLEAAGLMSKNTDSNNRPQRKRFDTLHPKTRYKPTLQKTITRRNNILLSPDLQKRLSRAQDEFAEDDVADDPDLDDEMLRYTRDCMTQILFSKPIEFADVYSLNDLFQTDAGRRRFTQIMQATMKEIPSLVLSDNSFELLLYLINTILQQMDLSDSKDLMAAKVLMNTACSLSRVTDSGHQFVREFIQSYALWKDINFWEEYFWDSLAKKHKKKYGNQVYEVDRDLTVALVFSFVYNMLNWGAEPATARQFAKEVTTRNGINLSYISQIDDIVNTYQVGTGVLQNTKEIAHHKFHEKNFASPTFCNYCRQFIWGVTSKQGLKCEACKYKIHKKCLNSVQGVIACNSALVEVKLGNASTPPSPSPVGRSHSSSVSLGATTPSTPGRSPSLSGRQ